LTAIKHEDKLTGTIVLMVCNLLAVFKL